MKNRKNNKKGFTIVELVIVIAVIGILSAILIPTFTNLTKQAQDAAARDEVSQAYNAYVIQATTDAEDDIYAIGEVAVKRGTEWYTYKSNTWTKEDDGRPTTSTGDALYTYANSIGVYENRA